MNVKVQLDFVLILARISFLNLECFRKYTSVYIKGSMYNLAGTVKTSKDYESNCR